MAKRLGDYTDEEKAFISQYGEFNFNDWERIGQSLKHEYKELEKHFSVVADLMANFYDDLEAFAAMYRNVILIDNEDYDSVFFFSTHYNQIRGYKRRLQLDMSAKAKLCRLYLDNPALFSRFSKKYAGVDFYYIKHANKPDVPILQAVRRFHEGKISHVTSIDDLSETQCNVLIEHIGGVQNEYRHLLDYDLTLPSRDTTAGNAIEFALNRYIPMMLTSGKSDYADRLSIRHLIRALGREQVRRDIDEVKKKYTIVATYKEDRQELSKESTSLKYKLYDIQNQKKDLNFERIDRIISDTSKNRYSWNGLYFERDNSDLKWIKEAKQKLNVQEEALLQRKEQLEKELKLINVRIQEEMHWIAQYVTALPTFRVLYEQRDNVLRGICHTEQTIVNYLWLHYPETMQAIEKYRYGLYNFHIMGRSVNSYVYTRPDKPHTEERDRYKVLRWTILRRRPLPSGKGSELIPMDDYLSGKYSFQVAYSNRSLMTRWLKDAIKLTREEQERLSREHELRAQQLEKQRKIEEERRKKEESERVQFNQRHAHYRDTLLQFDKTKHQYTYNGNHLQSVTELIDSFFPKFDAAKYARVTASREGITTGEVLKRWEDLGRESQELGTAMHKKIELFFQGINLQVDDSFKLFKMFADKIHLNPYRTEWAVFDEDHGIAGTIDFVDFTDGRFTIYDWKRSDKILSNGVPLKASKYGEKGNYPIENLDNCPYYHYALQLGIYKYILERKYNIQVSELRLGIFHPSYDKPYVLRMPYLGDEVNKLMDLRSEVVL